MNEGQELPQGEEIRARMDDGATIVVRRLGAPAPQRVVISHGNGLAIDAFAEFTEALLARGFEVVAVDLRNHGRNPFHPVSGPNWPRFIRDFPQILTAIDTAWGQQPTHGAFHSLSAAACLFAQVDAPYPWQSLTLYEPPIPAGPQSAHFQPFVTYHNQLSDRALRRRPRFVASEELVTSMRRSSLFRLVSDANLARLARATLRPDVSGGWTLCCPPSFEAETFRIEAISKLRPNLAEISCPVRIVLGDRSIHYAPELVDVGNDLARDFGFDRVELPQTTHFMQLERPEACASLVADGSGLPLDP